MIARAGTGWQTTLADLSLILFLVLAAGVKGSAPHASVSVRTCMPALGEPVAIWSPAPGGPGLSQWLAAQPPDPRQRLTLFASPQAHGQAQALAREVGRPVRMVFDPGISGPPFVALSYDQTSQMAQGLLKD